MNLRKVITIGAYGFDEHGFFQALQAAEVDTFCDIRMRRGVRGSEYAFANSKQLQDRLSTLAIRYIHARNLAPTQEIRQLQYTDDAETGARQRSRTTLGSAFVQAYAAGSLAGFDPAAFVRQLGNAQVIALFCVEREASACHRSLVAARLAHDLGVQVEHLKP